MTFAKQHAFGIIIGILIYELVLHKKMGGT